MAEPSTRNFGDSLFREIHKNSWLTRVPPKESKKVNTFNTVEEIIPGAIFFIYYFTEKRKGMDCILYT